MTSPSQEELNPLAHGSNVVCDHCKDFKNLPSSAHSTNRIPLCQSAPVPNEPSDDIKTGKPIETSFDRTRREVQSHEPSDGTTTDFVAKYDPKKKRYSFKDPKLSAIGDELEGGLEL